MALSSLALVACTNDEVIEESRDAIVLSASTDAITRAGAVATNNNNFTEFKTWAFTTTDGTLYLQEKVKKNAQGTWSFEDTHFWPDEALDFYGVSPATTNATITGTSQKIDNYVVDGSTDLLYGVRTNQTRENLMTTDGKTQSVYMNFRHALAQLIFRGATTNDNLGVKIAGVKLAKAYTQGDFTFATSNTGNQAATDTQADTETDNSWGSWANQETLTDGIEANVEGKILLNSGNNSASYITKHEIDVEKKVCKLEGLFVLPQELQYWNPTTDTDAANIITNKAYFIISCKVWNITGDEEVDKSPVYLWGSANEYKDVAVPVVIPDDDATTDDTFTWKQGKKYVYTFNFSQGAGYIPPTGGEDSGEPVIVPISIGVSVDDFQEAFQHPATDMKAE